MKEFIEYRNSQKLSQKQLAKLIGVSQATMCDYEKGNKKPSTKKAVFGELTNAL
jgi:DNA-binding XRE family transcriptional regulator